MSEYAGTALIIFAACLGLGMCGLGDDYYKAQKERARSENFKACIAAGKTYSELAFTHHPKCE